MFFRRPKVEPEYELELHEVVARATDYPDDETRAIVTAIVGLLGCVSYADRDFSDAEQAVVNRLLLTLNGIEPEQARAILRALGANVVHVATIELPRYCRTLVQLATRELRVDVLAMLLEVAAADEEISHDEVVLLRQITKSLGLDQADYTRLQKVHLDLLSALKVHAVDNQQG